MKKVKIDKSWYAMLKGEFKEAYWKDLTNFVRGEYVKEKVYPPPKDKCWLYNQEKVDKFIKEGRISFRKSGAPFLKRYLKDLEFIIKDQLSECILVFKLKKLATELTISLSSLLVEEIITESTS